MSGCASLKTTKLPEAALTNTHDGCLLLLLQLFPRQLLVAAAAVAARGLLVAAAPFAARQLLVAAASVATKDLPISAAPVATDGLLVAAAPLGCCRPTAEEVASGLLHMRSAAYQ
eukprot:GHUV01025846.1.p2 GENE.GHUV01025846.1~~GHUV01025846.1.p2  ORF type:complete len:115 (-),score=43.87 GHUV01025846.1:74-418(-)